jgi:hypothetical protein
MYFPVAGDEEKIVFRPASFEVFLEKRAEAVAFGLSLFS